MNSAYPLLTDIGRSFGDGQVGAHAPGSAMVVLLTAAAVCPRGVVLALAAQLPLVEHAAVGVQVALAPESQRDTTDKDRPTGGRHTLIGGIVLLEGNGRRLLSLWSLCVCLTGLFLIIEILVGYRMMVMHLQSLIMFSFVKTKKKKKYI